MTDMTAELELIEWIKREMPAGTVIGDPEWWASRIAHRARALSAPRVPEGWRDFVAEVVESAEGYESRSGNKVNGDWVARGRVLLTAAQSPADYVCHKCGKKTSPPKPFKLYVSCESCGATTAATIAKDLASLSPAVPAQDELANLRKRVRELEWCFHKMIGVPASTGVCEPIEGYVKRPHDAVDAMREMAARLRGGSDE